jgi:hypothetical protein
MDHLCIVCEKHVTTNGFKHGPNCEWFNRPGHFTGTFVSYNISKKFVNIFLKF